MTRSDSPRSTSHSRSVPSSLPLSTLRLSGVKARPFTTALWPSSAALFAIPQPDHVVKAATGEQAAIRAPGQRIHRASVAIEGLAVHTPVGVPESDGRIKSPTGERASLGGKRQALDAVGMPARPEQGTMLQVPQLEGPIPAPSGQRAFVRAEGKGPDYIEMRLPGQMQGLAWLAPHAHFPPPAPRGPVLPAVMASRVSVNVVSRKVASASLVSCSSTPCRDTPRRAKWDRSSPRRSPRSSRSSATRLAGLY